MQNKLIFIFNVLNEVLPGRVYYALQVKENAKVPFIVYQEISKRSTSFHDDHSFMKTSTIQISLITNSKDLALEKELEDKLTLYDVEFQMTSEYYLKDSGVYRIYEIKMEEFKYEQ